MERHLDQELAEYRELLHAMGAHAQQALTQSVQAVLARDDESARKVIADDCLLDRLEMEIDARSVSLLALQGPVATDLRQIIAAMRIAQNLERIGDEATKIARRALALNRLPRLEETVDLPGLASWVDESLREALEAWQQGDLARAQPLAARDKNIDALNREYHDKLTSQMVDNPNNVVRCLHWMTACKCLERIGDHAVNIAEATVYHLEARDIRHATHPKVIIPFTPDST